MASKKQQRSRSSSRTQGKTSKRAAKRTSKSTRSEPTRRAAPARESKAPARESNESGLPGGGRGRRDEVGGSGVFPASGGEAPADAELRGMASWGQGERGAEGYNDSGGSELVMREGQLLGGLDVGPSGAPITDNPSAEGAEAKPSRKPKQSGERTPRQQRRR